MAILERLSDGKGSIVLGWVSPSVFYARFERTIGVALAERFARRLGALIGDSIRVRYFGDSSAVASYEPQAMAPIASMMQSKRRRFDSIVVLPWQGVMGAAASAFADAFGCLEYVTAPEFERRLRAAVPGADARALAVADDAAEASSDDGASAAPRARSAIAPRLSQSVAYSYVFDLSEFEVGRFTATRSEHLGERPGQGWVCVARDDQQALELARQAARLEWAQPSSRRAEEFTVEFRRSPPKRERPFDRRL